MLLSLFLAIGSCLATRSPLLALPGFDNAWQDRPDHLPPVEARAVVTNPKNPHSHVRGHLTFTQESPSAPVRVDGIIEGLPPGKHGFHVHQSGDITTDGCDSAGPHFNPFNRTHGGQYGYHRHQGDLGNINARADGTAIIHIIERSMTMFGQERSILNRAIVVHANVDDLGKGDAPDSHTTGHSGPRIGCGVITPTRK